jgi:hypothetical protein
LVKPITPDFAAVQAGERRDVDDPSRALRAEVRHAGAGEAKRPAEADVHDQVPVGVLDLPHDAVAQHPGVVDQHVDPARPLHGRRDDAVDVGAAGHVGNQRHAARLLGGRRERRLVAVDHRHAGARLGERF